MSTRQKLLFFCFLALFGTLTNLKADNLPSSQDIKEVVINYFGASIGGRSKEFHQTTDKKIITIIHKTLKESKHFKNKYLSYNNNMKILTINLDFDYDNTCQLTLELLKSIDKEN